MKNNFSFACVVICGLVCGNIGCKPSVHLDGVVPVSGIVTLDDVPLADAVLSFQPQNRAGSNKMRAGVAMTDANGEFKAMTLQAGDGLFPGEFKVTVSKTETESYTAEQQKMLDEGKRVRPQKSRELVPAIYTNVKKSPLIVTVNERGKTDIKLELTSASPPKQPTRK
ncbi:hypothetical protein FACS189443_3430 [Planctomycetales bacterium]|nr:hypothetical protein FACS189443_3430 [Planctomycetales bacterium]